MGKLLSQRSHPCAHEFPTLRRWSEQMVLVYHSGRLNEQHPSGLDPVVGKLKASVSWSGLWDGPEGTVIYRVRVRCSDGCGYRLEWIRRSSLGTLFDVWERRDWTGKGKGKVSSARDRTTHPRASV